MPCRPNILLIFTDQQRFDTIGRLGNPLIRTPELDRLVQEGTAFTRTYSPSPVCVPARCALMTGLPPHLAHCTDNVPMPQDVPSVADVLSQAGYQTHSVGKMHFTPDFMRPWGFQSRDTSEELEEEKDDFRNFLDTNGYDHVIEQNGLRGEYYYIPQPSQLPARLHQTTWVADRSIDFLRRRDRARPFFLMSSFIKPHPPFETPTPWNKIYRPTEMPLPFHAEDEEEVLTYWNRVQNRYKHRDAGDDALAWRTMKAAYYSCISFIDHNVGRILAELGDEIDQTLIVFSSDHGEYLGDYGCVGKRAMHDVSTRIPMLARWPGHFPANHRCEAPATLLDLSPTFCAAAGITRPLPSEEGQNLVDVANGTSDRTVVFSQFQSGPYALYMATDGAWKYVYSAPDQREWLFNLRDGSQETCDYSHDPSRPELAALRNALLRRMADDPEAVEKGTWRKYAPRSIPENPDEGLLFQDPSALAGQIASLKQDRYFHDVPVRNGFMTKGGISPEFPSQKKK